WKAGAANVFLLGMSLWFYGYLNPSYLAIICSSIALNFLLCAWMRRVTGSGPKKGILFLTILINLGILGYFKYADFFLSNVNAIFGTDLPLLRIALPLGISFFTFQQLSYCIDTYYERAQKTDFITYACYVSFFPQLVAGPIVTQDEFLPQFQDPEKRKVQWDNLADGCYLFILGLAKKIMIADTFGQVVTAGYSVIPDLNSPSAVFLIFSYTMQIYFDFSGYCDMAMGIGKMFNIELPVNFDSPYKAKGIADFWGRWHVTLTRFFTKYVYIPLGGNRKGTARTCLNVMIIFLLSGLWHGANWTFVFWGACHGIYMVIARLLKKPLEKVPGILRWAVCFVFVNIAWVFFRAESFSQAFAVLERVVQGGWGSLPYYFTACFQAKGMDLIINRLPMAGKIPGILTALFVGFTCYVTFFTRNARERVTEGKRPLWKAVVAAALLVWCVLSFENVSAFLYFNF
ncbi:MAG: MBOAT family protein, partial [Lachnospiraceae bacterium]|nr:MBOAT family protein [Lachnospiraceae bacterium]